MGGHYNSTYAPPIPTLSVTFGRGGERPWLGPLEAIIDTGADVTIVPGSIVQRLKAPPLSTAQLESQWGDVHPVDVYMLDVDVAGQLLPSTVVAGDPETSEVILGRNVLNKLPLLLDGPEQLVQILDEATARRLRERQRQ